MKVRYFLKMPIGETTSGYGPSLCDSLATACTMCFFDCFTPPAS